MSTAKKPRNGSKLRRPRTAATTGATTTTRMSTALAPRNSILQCNKVGLLHGTSLPHQFPPCLAGSSLSNGEMNDEHSPLAFHPRPAPPFKTNNMDTLELAPRLRISTTSYQATTPHQSKRMCRRTIPSMPNHPLPAVAPTPLAQCTPSKATVPRLLPVHPVPPPTLTTRE